MPVLRNLVAAGLEKAVVVPKATGSEAAALPSREGSSKRFAVATQGLFTPS